MIRSLDPSLMKEATTLYSGWNSEGFNYEGWLGNRANLMFVDEENGNVGLLTQEYPGVFTGHYFFRVGGRPAIRFADKCIEEVFTEYGAKLLRGLTRPENKPALWMNRKLGMTSYGVIETKDGPHELFCLTKTDWENK
jgi:hypothetical protein